MPDDMTLLVAGAEPQYSRSVFEAILGRDDVSRQEFVCDDKGVWVKQVDSAGSLEWHPLSEITGPSVPNPLDEPWLPFPFTARQLAALMIDGWGHFIREKYGDWDHGPDSDGLANLGPRAGKAREALMAAYEAYRRAQRLAPSLAWISTHRNLHKHGRLWSRSFAAANDQDALGFARAFAFLAQ